MESVALPVAGNTSFAGIHGLAHIQHLAYGIP
jgi:hypothetical protein